MNSFEGAAALNDSVSVSHHSVYGNRRMVSGSSCHNSSPKTGRREAALVASEAKEIAWRE
jgi:hypothetical protein